MTIQMLLDYCAKKHCQTAQFVFNIKPGESWLDVLYRTSEAQLQLKNNRLLIGF